MSLSEKDLLAMPADDYMNDEQISFFKQRLLDKQRVLQERLNGHQKVMVGERAPDAADMASGEESRSLAMSFVSRDTAELKRVSLALAAITEDEYGYCQETGVEIGIPRLLAVPESLYSVEAMSVIEAQRQHLRGVA